MAKQAPASSPAFSVIQATTSKGGETLQAGADWYSQVELLKINPDWSRRMNLNWIVIQASCSTHPALMGREHASGNKELLHYHGDVSCTQGPPLGWQLCREVWCCASVLDGQERGGRGAAALWVCVSPSYFASGQSLWAGLQMFSWVCEFSC